jgi:DNA repair exonuclease SbcCD nuclease subunit
MLHGQVTYSGGAARDTVCLPRLAGKGIDYLALGHEHSYRCEALDARGVWCYSGCPEGRGYDECGEKGVVLLTLTEDATAPSGAHGESRFLPIAHRTLHHVCVSVTQEDNERTLTARVLQQTAQLPAKDIVLVELIGEISAEPGLDPQGAAIALRERFYAARLDNHTALVLDPTEYLHDISLKGEFIRTVMATNMPKETRDRVIMCGLRALRGEEAEL